jgi:hypothetical protein
MKRIAITLAALATLVVPAVAQARSELSLTAADRAAARVQATTIIEENELLTEWEEPLVSSYELTPCDRESRFRALCDTSDHYGDGTSCESTLEVIASGPHLWSRWVDSLDEEAC